MKVHVEWLDGERRTYDNVEKVQSGTDQVLRLYGYLVGGRAPVIAELPTFSIREWRREER